MPATINTLRWKMDHLKRLKSHQFVNEWVLKDINNGAQYLALEVDAWMKLGCPLDNVPDEIDRSTDFRRPVPNRLVNGLAGMQQQQPLGTAAGGATFTPVAQPTMPNSHQQQCGVGGNGALFTPGPHPHTSMVYTNQQPSNYNAGFAPEQNWAYGSPFDNQQPWNGPATFTFNPGPMLPLDPNGQQSNFNAGFASAQVLAPMGQFGVNGGQFTTPQQMGLDFGGDQFDQPQQLGPAVGGDQFPPLQVQTVMLPTFPQPQLQQPAPVAGRAAWPDWLPSETPTWVDGSLSGLPEETGVSGPNPTNPLPAGRSEATSGPEMIQRERPDGQPPALSRAQRRLLGINVPTHRETREAVARVAVPLPVAAPVVPGPEGSYLTPESPFPKHRSPSRDYDSLFGSPPAPEPEEVQPTESEREVEEAQHTEPEQEEDHLADFRLTDEEFDALMENHNFDDESTQESDGTVLRQCAESGVAEALELLPLHALPSPPWA